MKFKGATVPNRNRAPLGREIAGIFAPRRTFGT